MNDPAVPTGTRVEIAVRNDGRTRTVSVAGEIDVLVRARLRAALADALGEKPSTVVLDLGQVTFMDSTGLHAVLDADAHARAEQIELVVIPGPPSVHRVFELCGLESRLTFVRSEDGRRSIVV
jgi:anti-sigma B factor antagonist